MRSRLAVRTIVSLSLLVAAACGATQDGGIGGDGTPSGAAGNRDVAATLKDFTITLDTDTVDNGEVTFDISNEGPSEHEFVIVETSADVGAGDLPTKDGAVAEDGLQVVDEVEAIGAGDEEELTVDLAQGHYIVFCNIDGHYLSGMHAELEVR